MGMLLYEMSSSWETSREAFVCLDTTGLDGLARQNDQATSCSVAKSSDSVPLTLDTT